MSWPTREEHTKLLLVEAPPQQVDDRPFIRASWTGGHGTLPYEQNTQQSPALGLSRAPHPVHS